MNRNTSLFRGFALMTALGLGVAACDGGDGPLPAPELPTITAAPATMNLVVGQSHQIQASVTGVAQGVDFSSTADAIASVDAQGIVRALGPGAATIKVTSRTDRKLETAVAVNVVQAQLPATDEARVVIQSVTRGTTITPIDPTRVQGQVDITLAVQRGPATELRVYVGDRQINRCTQVFGSNGTASDGNLTAEGLTMAQGSNANVVCSVHTDEFDPATGLAAFRNAEYRIRAELRQGGNVIDFAQTGVLTFANVDRLTARVSAGRTTISTRDMLRWNAGDIIIRALPVIYSDAPGELNPNSIRVSLSGYYQGVPVTVTATSTERDGNAFVLRFRSDLTPAQAPNGILGFNTGPEGAQLRGTSITAGGQIGPTEDWRWVFELDLLTGTVPGTARLRIDNEAPHAGVFELMQLITLNGLTSDRNGWINGAYNFASGKRGEHDAPFGIQGVGIGAVTFHALRIDRNAANADNLANNRAIAEGQAAITSGAQLQQTITNNEYIVVARVADQLNNVSYVRLTTAPKTGIQNRIGVDFPRPLIEHVGDPAQWQYTDQGLRILTGTTFTVRSIDDVSRSEGYAGPAHTTFRTYFVTNAGRTQVGVTSDIHPLHLGLAPIWITSTFTVPGAPIGYYEVEAWVVDRAGNQSEILTARRYIDDFTRPEVSNIRMPTALTFIGGQPYDFTVFARDNVDLRYADFRFVYATAPWPHSPLDFELPVWDMQISPFGPPIVSSIDLTATVNFVRSVQFTTPAGVPTGPSHPATHVRFRVWDHSTEYGQTNTQVNNLVANSVPAGRSFAAAPYNVSRMEIDVANRRVTSYGVTGTFANPFQVVRFYYIDDLGLNRFVLNQAGAPGAVNVRAEDVGTGFDGRRWHYDLATQLPCNVPVFAVGISGFDQVTGVGGDALVSPVVPGPTTNCYNPPRIR